MYPYRKNPLLKKKCTRSMSYYYVTEIYTHKMRIHNEYSVNVQTKAQGLLRIDTYTERIKPDNNFGFK